MAEGQDGICLDGRYQNQEAGAASGKYGGAGCCHRGWVGRDSDGILPEAGRNPGNRPGGRPDWERADEKYHGEDYIPTQSDI